MRFCNTDLKTTVDFHKVGDAVWMNSSACYLGKEASTRGKLVHFGPDTDTECPKLAEKVTGIKNYQAEHEHRTCSDSKTWFVLFVDPLIPQKKGHIIVQTKKIS